MGIIFNKILNSGFTFIVIIYLIIYGSIIHKGEGIPYIIDNNETFSSLTHARSIDSFGISKSKGLADEALGPNEDAHPYVHSHQGNFPRIFAFIFYKLGAESPESQILITIFTIGLLSIFVMFKFIELISNSRLAFIFSLVLISDYIFFAQSQIITYRLFFPLLLFVQLFAIEYAINKKGHLWKLILFLNSFLLLYGELVFASSVGLLGFFWLLYRSIKKPRIIINLSCIMLFGAISGLSLLVIQGILYLGLDNFLYDIEVTFLARNSFDGDTIKDTLNFYQQNHVIFWENFANRSNFLNLSYYLNALFLTNIKYNGPLILLFISPPLIFWITSQFLMNSRQRFQKAFLVFKNNFFMNARQRVQKAFLVFKNKFSMNSRQRVQKAFLVFKNKFFALATFVLFYLMTFYITSWAITDLNFNREYFLGNQIKSVLFFAAFIPISAFLSNLYGRKLILNLPSYGRKLILNLPSYGRKLILNLPSPGIIFKNKFFTKGYLEYVFLNLSLAGLFILVAMYLQKYYLMDNWISPFSLILVTFVSSILLILTKKIKIKLAIGLVIFLSLFLILIFSYLSNSQQALWSFLHGPLNNFYIFFVFFGSLVSAFIWLDRYLSLPSNNLRDIYKYKLVFIFLLCSVLSFTVAYWLSPGYIYSGYVYRYTSFLPHIFSLAFALSLCIQFDVITRACNETLFKRIFISSVVTFTLISSSIYWISVQYSYYQNLSPDHFSFLSRLKFPPYKDSSFISNTYPVPISIYTESWAYLDDKLSTAILKNNGDVKKIIGDNKYLWQADRKTNMDYKKPDFYLCLMHQTPETLKASILFRQGLGSKPGGCNSSALFGMANDPSNNFVTLVDFDRKQNAGFMSWAIYEFDWYSDGKYEIMWNSNNEAKKGYHPIDDVKASSQGGKGFESDGSEVDFGLDE